LIGARANGVLRPGLGVSRAVGGSGGRPAIAFAAAVVLGEAAAGAGGLERCCCRRESGVAGEAMAPGSAENAGAGEVGCGVVGAGICR
jgi:hypothetical protein